MRSFIFSILVLATLTACEGGSVKRSLGMEEKVPDEFMVMSNPSLNIPPDFNHLPEPKGNSMYRTTKVPARAKSQLIQNADGSVQPSEVTDAEKIILSKADTQHANPNIKELLAEENAIIRDQREILTKEEAEDSDFLGLGSLLGSPFKPEPKDPIVDAEKEQARIRDNMKNGKDITDGEVPVIEREKTPLEEILN